MTDIAAIRRRDAYLCERFTTHHAKTPYRDIQRPDTEDAVSRLLEDALVDRRDLLREVDRLEADLRKTKSLAGESEAWAEAKGHEADAKRIEIAELNRALDQARAAAQNEATQRQKAEAENERLRSTLKESQAAWAQENAAAENYLGHMKTFGDEIAKLRAELEALRAPLPDAELAEIEREHAEVGEQFDRWGVDGKAGGVAHGHRDTLLRALKAERARVSSCRPVVEAVRRYRAASRDKTKSWPQRLKRAADTLLDMPLPTLPEKP